ncbi:MAG TPA: PqqD family protein [Chloroflexota bacterium]
MRIADRLVDGELVLYDPDEQRLHVLNPTAGLIWRLCDGKHQESDLVETLAGRYPRNRSAIEEDVPRIIGRFRSEGLLQP